MTCAIPTINNAIPNFDNITLEEFGNKTIAICKKQAMRTCKLMYTTLMKRLDGQAKTLLTTTQKLTETTAELAQVKKDFAQYIETTTQKLAETSTALTETKEKFTTISTQLDDMKQVLVELKKASSWEPWKETLSSSWKSVSETAAQVWNSCQPYLSHPLTVGTGGVLTSLCIYKAIAAYRGGDMEKFAYWRNRALLAGSATAGSAYLLWNNAGVEPLSA